MTPGDYHLDIGLPAPEELARGKSPHCSDAGIRELLADDHVNVRASLRQLLGPVEGVTVVAVAADGAEAVELARLHRPDVVVMDLRMPVLCGLAATREIVAAGLSRGVLILTASARRRDVGEALDAGAAGYLLKDADPEELVCAIRKIGG